MNNLKYVILYLFIVILNIAIGRENKTSGKIMEIDSPIDSIRIFKKEFRNDSLGLDGYRIEHISILDSTKNTLLINGINIVGYTKSQVLDLLGKPNFWYRGREEEGDGPYGMYYTLKTNLSLQVELKYNKVYLVHLYNKASIKASKHHSKKT